MEVYNKGGEMTDLSDRLTKVEDIPQGIIETYPQMVCSDASSYLICSNMMQALP